MSDSIEISNIRAWGKYGVTEAERAHLQILRIDLNLSVDLSRSALSDDLEDTIDYAEIHSKVVVTVESNSFKLLETLAAKILSVVFEDKRIVNAKVLVAKPEKLAGATPTVALSRANQ